MRASAERRFKELILWLCAYSETDRYFGAVKLNKLLFFIDLEAMKRFGRTITGQRYQKLEQGPAPRAIVPVMDEMVRYEEIATRKRNVFAYEQKKTFALKDPDASVFEPEELEIINAVVDRYTPYSATQISMESHDFIGWRVVDIGEDIPMGAALISRRPLTEREVAYGRSLAQQYA
jgi:uncharacterized phage-associated protein